MDKNVVRGDMGGGKENSLKVNYPGNSHKNKDKNPSPPAKKVEKVISGEAITRKKTFGSKFKETLTGEDARSVGAYILFDVIIPAAKAMLADAASQGAERMLFGDSNRNRRSSISKQGYTSYNRMYNRDEKPTRRDLSQRARATHDFAEVVLSSRGEAEEVLDRLNDLIDTYDMATVSDLYDLVGITGSFTDDKWGWFDLRGATIRPVREGYLILLPKTQPLD